MAPTGGPKDTIPPVLLSVTPRDSTLKFHSKEIRLEFDEYIQLKNLQQEMIISPNPKKNPEIKTKLNTLTILWEHLDSLKKNTTYIINMGGAIQDLNEGNKFDNFRYVFSTGDYLDSLELTGKVIDARTGIKDSTASVMLYDVLKDSVVTNEKPTYYSRLDSAGNFHFQNLPHGVFKIFALQEKEGDLRYTDTSKLIAYIEDPIKLDTTKGGIILSLFKEDYEMAERLRSELTVRSSLDFGRQSLKKPLIMTFNHRLKSLNEEGIHVEADTTKEDSLFHQMDFKVGREDDSLQTTLTLTSEWVENTSYRLVLDSAFATDTLGYSFPRNDTLTFRTERLPRVRKTKKDKKKEEEEEEEEKKRELKYTISAQSQKLELKKPLRLSFDAPIDTLDPAKIQIEEGVDLTDVNFEVEKDTSDKDFDILYDWKPETKYRIFLDSAFAIDSSGLAYAKLDTLSLEAKSKSDYGILILHFDTTQLFNYGGMEEEFVFGSYGRRPKEEVKTEAPSDDVSVTDSIPAEEDLESPDSLENTDSEEPEKDSVIQTEDAAVTAEKTFPEKIDSVRLEDGSGSMQQEVLQEESDTLKKDSIPLRFAGREEIPDSFQLVVELYKGKDLVASGPIRGRTWRKEYLDPGDYQVRVILDENGNGKWDSGCYYCEVKTQPEKVFSVPATYTVRANWENDNPGISIRFKISDLR